ncbi:ATP synthase E chain domain-containing protein [Histoplasma capsulatum var. duboisii H88]|uniref:ATP synthase E chain domain-containing protein n=1 Tax=Ajellomyces capsulatus (strain H88) TaxID=544711 RepID=A0A8A1LTK2_AJEC8|nr:ATP synthase E chain domain-containing protein [Histoplasma capsulatum var. duboisii H88]
MVFIYLFTVSSSLFDVEGWTRSRASLSKQPWPYKPTQQNSRTSSTPKAGSLAINNVNRKPLTARKPSRNVRADAYRICSPSLHISPSLAGTHTEHLPWLLRKVSTYYVTPPLAQALSTASSTNRPSLHKPSKRR